MRKVRDVMSRFAVVALQDETIKQVAKKMETYNVGFIVIVDQDKHPVGVVTDRDLTIRALGYGLGSETPVKEVMTTDVIAVTEDADLFEALKIMEENGIRRLPVLDIDEKVIGVVTADEILVRLIGQLNKLGTIYALSLRPGII